MALRKLGVPGSAGGAPRRTPRRFPAITALALLSGALLLSGLAQAALAQQPTPLFDTPPNNPAAAPGPGTGQPIPIEPLPAPPAAPAAAPPAAGPAPAAPSRIFCEQSVTAQPADPAMVAERYRTFVGIFSDADWNPQTCAALIVETVTDDGTATITYIFGPLASGGKTAGGVLHGTGVIKDGALLFQNTDGSQYAFRPFYSDLAGKWTTPKGQTLEAIFKRSF
ncbi:MAG TPA: hypothetical protein VG651_14980 [Stellaceae bacterium]|nr:hypothetical protein [Stellaceae bacterium]